MSGLPDKIAFLLYVLSLVLAGLTADKVVSFAAGTGTPAFPRSKEVFKKIPLAAGAPETGAAGDRYIAIKPDRFCGRNEYAAPIVKQEGTGIRAVYVLRGTLIHSNAKLSRAFIEIPGVSGQQAYCIGDSVHGAVVVDIKPGLVTLKRGEETVNLTVSYQDHAPPASVVWGRSALSRSDSWELPRSGDREGYRAERKEQFERLSEQKRGDLETWYKLKRLRERSSRYREQEKPYPGISRGMLKLLERFPPDQRRRILQAPPKERARLIREFIKAQKEARRRFRR